MAVIADFPNYPVWAESVKDTEVLEAGPDGRARQVAFNLDAGPLTTTSSSMRGAATGRCGTLSRAR